MHVAAKCSGQDVILECSCSTFSTILATNLTDNDQKLSSCCHCRLLREILAHLANPVSPLSPCINASKVQSGKSFVTSDVLQLKAKSGVDRFSVTADGSTELVTIFNISRTSRNIVKCHSSICKMNSGSCRNIRYLRKDDNLCPHLSIFKIFYLQQVMVNLEDSDLDEDDVDEDFEPDLLPSEKVSLLLYSIKSE